MVGCGKGEKYQGSNHVCGGRLKLVAIVTHAHQLQESLRVDESVPLDLLSPFRSATAAWPWTEDMRPPGRRAQETLRGEWLANAEEV